MKKLHIPIFLFFLVLSINLYSQKFVESPNYEKKNENDIYIKKISTNSYYTQIDFIYKNSKEKGLYIFLSQVGHKNAYYIKANGNRYNLISTQNIGNANGITVATPDIFVQFSARFEKIPDYTKKFDLIEGIDGTWNFFGINYSTSNTTEQQKNNKSLESSHEKICNYNVSNNKKDKIKFGEVNNVNDVALVERLVNSLNLNINFFIIKCKNFDNAAAFIHLGKRVILYDVNFINDMILNSTKYSKIGVLAHEIGHHLLGHTNSKSLSMSESRQRELDADEIAGYMLKLYECPEKEAYKFIELLKENSNKNSTHPDKNLRIVAVKKGYNKKINNYSNVTEELPIIIKVNELNISGKFDDALSLLRKDETNGKWSDDLSLFIKASVLMSNQLWEEAYFTYLKISPYSYESDATFQYNYGYCLQSMGKFMEAKKQYEICLDNSPNRTDALGNLALIYRDNLKDSKTAIKLLERCIKINKNDAHIYNVLSVTYSKYLKDNQKGLYYSTIASDLEPLNLEYKKNKALNNLLLGNYAKCYEVFKNLCNDFSDENSCQILVIFENEFSNRNKK